MDARRAAGPPVDLYLTLAGVAAVALLLAVVLVVPSSAASVRDPDAAFGASRDRPSLLDAPPLLPK